jgi:ABC-type multidrug transport system ATPase subunit
MNGERLIQVDELVFEYPDGTRALDGVTFDIRENEFLALIGQNGSGKTTLSKCLNGILRPTRGSVRIGELDTRERGVTKKIVTKVGTCSRTPTTRSSTTPSTRRSPTAHATSGSTATRWRPGSARRPGSAA